MSTTYLTVQALTKYIKYKFDADPHLKDVYVKGELSNVKIHTSGHIYFTLKDAHARVQAAMFRSQAGQLKFRPEEGMQVFIRGEVNVYEAMGNYQLYVQTMEPDGIGGLFLAFNQLKEQLEKEGLFEHRWKQPIPHFPETVGVITATTGAAVRDICSTIQRRYPKTKIRIYETLVQGKGAAASITSNIELANLEAQCDVLIVGRGGGSIEDLWAFNEEVVARAIFSSRIPIISAVGHETDTTIADFVADLRAPTPTAAAELAVPHERDVVHTILTRQAQIHQMISARLTHERARLDRLVKSYPLAQPERLYRPFTERLIRAEQLLQQQLDMSLMKKKQQFIQLDSRLQQQAPQQRLAAEKRRLVQVEAQLQRVLHTILHDKKQQFTTQIRTLEALNPLQILSRGYAAVYDEQSNIVTSVSDVSHNQPIQVAMKDGTLYATVEQIKQEER